MVVIGSIFDIASFFRPRFLDKTLFQEAMEAGLSLEAADAEAAVDICPERMDVVDVEALRPSRIGTAVEFWSGLGVETATRMQAVEDTCLDAL